jgi:hypothetical protein
MNVKAYFFKPKFNTVYTNVSANDVFLHTTIGIDYVYPVFKMPKTLPTTRLVSNKKIICVGCIKVNENDEIFDVNTDCVGMCLEDMAATFGFACPSEDTIACIMKRDDVIEAKDVIGDVSLETFKRSIIVNKELDDIMNV